MLPLIVKSKEATFALILMMADAQLRGRDMEDFCDSPYPYPKSPLPQNGNSLDRLEAIKENS